LALGSIKKESIQIRLEPLTHRNSKAVGPFYRPPYLNYPPLFPSIHIFLGSRMLKIVLNTLLSNIVLSNIVLCKIVLSKIFLSKIVLSFVMISLSSAALSNSTVFNNVKTLSIVEKLIDHEQPAASKKVLIVFDIDDTLLESDQFFGGDAWYNWQRGKALVGTDNKPVTIDEKDKITCLFSKLGTLYELGTFHVTEDIAVALVDKLQSRFDLMALTSRSPDYRGGTERELKKAGYNFTSAHLLGPSNALAYPFNDGKNTRGVSYQNGIVMSTGLHKGEVLDDLLKRIDKEYSTIYFIDDSRKNVDDMNQKWGGSSTDMTIFHYTGVDKRISAEDIQQGQDAGIALDKLMNTAFPDRGQRFSEGKCQ